MFLNCFYLLDETIYQRACVDIESNIKWEIAFVRSTVTLTHPIVTNIHATYISLS